METKTWCAKAHNRQLITNEESDLINQKLKTLHYRLNTYIKTLKGNSGS